MTIKGYANYGVLAHEKQTIFTVAAPHPRTKVAEKVEITIPDGWEVSENATGEKLIGTPDGKTYLADEIISSYGDSPVLSWFDGNNSHRIKLNWAVSM